MRAVELFVWLGLAYTALGVVFALAAIVWGLAHLDATTRGASLGLRLLLFPGFAALWPLLAWRWWCNRRAGLPEPPVERTAHRQLSLKVTQ